VNHSQASACKLHSGVAMSCAAYAFGLTSPIQNTSGTDAFICTTITNEIRHDALSSHGQQGAEFPV